MHSQPLFDVTDAAETRRIIRSYPLATLLTCQGGLEAHLLPLEIHDRVAPGRLRGHVGKQHPIALTADGSEVLAVFQGPSSYISPRWYINGQRSGRVAPSWNYLAVEVRGLIRLIHDVDWILGHLESLTQSQEQHRTDPWTLQHAAPGFAEGIAQGLVGFEIEIARCSGRRFLSQQRTQADRFSVIAHLSAEPSGAAKDLAALIVP